MSGKFSRQLLLGLKLRLAGIKKAKKSTALGCLHNFYGFLRFSVSEGDCVGCLGFTGFGICMLWIFFCFEFFVVVVVCFCFL